MTAHETTPSDAAIGQAFRETHPGLKDALTFLREVEHRAREIEQGRGALAELPEKLVDDLIHAGRIIERMENPQLKPLSEQNFRQYESARRTEYSATRKLRDYGEACLRMGNRDE